MPRRAPLDRFPKWTTPLIADACLRLRVAIRVAPAGLRPIIRGMRLAGPARPVRHYGSVDVFLEMANAAKPGEVVVIDNGGRLDEGCIGDLTVLEFRSAGLADALLWGLHRDSTELGRIEWPVFSYGTCPAGPQRLDPREPAVFASARLGGVVVTTDDFIFADDDGAIAVPRARLGELLDTAREIHALERRQTKLARTGTSLRDQFHFAEFLTARALDPALTFRQHLRRLDRAIEE